MNGGHDDLPGEEEAMATALRRAAGDIAGTIDTEEALERVRARARRHRGRRLITAAVGTAAAVAVGLVVLLTVGGDDRQVLRTPATPSLTADGRAAASAAPFSTSPPTSIPLPSTATASTSATTTAAPVAPPATVARPAPGATTVVAAPVTTAYHSTGGSIVVRVDGGTVALDAPPEPTPGWSVRIEDDGPARVRVRFQLDDRRSEIRVDLVDGQPVPRITED